MKRTVAALAAAAAALWCAPPGHADVGGQVPGPGLCDYPGVGAAGMDMGVYHFVCDFPTEINGSHWHCEYGGGVVIGNVGVSISMFRASISTPVGVLEGSCSWRCPDGRLSATPPNPPGAWKDRLTPKPCTPVGDPPGAVTAGGEGGLGPAVTNPADTNPVDTVNPH